MKKDETWNRYVLSAHYRYLERLPTGSIDHRAVLRQFQKKDRWLSNLAFMIGNPLLDRLALPILAIDAALIARQR